MGKVTLEGINAVFSGRILQESEKIALGKFLKEYPQISLRSVGNHKIHEIRFAEIKVGNTTIELPETLKKVYNNLVEEEVYNLIVKIIEGKENKDV